jgi:hypothetical protein
MRKTFHANNEDAMDENGKKKKKKKKPRSLSVEETKTDEEILAQIDFSCLDTPRRAGE